MCKKQQASQLKTKKSLDIPEPLPGTLGLNKIGDAINLEAAGDTGSDFCG